MRAREHRSLDRVIGKHDIGVGAAAALALGVDLQLVASQSHTRDQAGQRLRAGVGDEGARDVHAVQLDAHVGKGQVLFLDRDAHQRVAAGDRVRPAGKHFYTKGVVAVMAIMVTVLAVPIVIVAIVCQGKRTKRNTGCECKRSEGDQRFPKRERTE